MGGGGDEGSQWGGGEAKRRDARGNVANGERDVKETRTIVQKKMRSNNLAPGRRVDGDPERTRGEA